MRREREDKTLAIVTECVRRDLRADRSILPRRKIASGSSSIMELPRVPDKAPTSAPTAIPANSRSADILGSPVSPSFSLSFSARERYFLSCERMEHHPDGMTAAKNRRRVKSNNFISRIQAAAAVAVAFISQIYRV